MAAATLPTIRLRGFNLARLVRRDNIKTTVFALKVILTFAALLALGLAGHTLYQDHTRAKELGGALATDVTTLLAPKPEAVVAKPKHDYTVITKNNIFGPLGQKQAVQVAKPATKLNLALTGTYVSSKEDPYAIIEDKKRGLQDVFNLNQSIFGEAKLVSVFPDRVEIDREGQREILRLDESSVDEGGASTGDASDFTVDEKELDAALSNLPLLLTQARAVPYFKDGKSVGLRLFAIKSESIFEKIGLKNGDILKSINENSLGDLSQAMKLFEKLKEERSIKVVLERNREEKEFRYQIR